MRTVKGRVLQLETRAPIANLVVAAFDVDRAISDEASLLRSDRLGSAITDQDGHFRIEFTDEEFRSGGERERRPDIVIALFKPHIAGSEEDPDASPLFVTAAPRAEAGRDEAFVVLVPRSLFAVDTATPPARSGAERLAASISNAIAARADFEASVAGAIAPEVTRRLALRRDGKTLARRILTAPRVRMGQTTALYVARDAGSEVLADVRMKGLERLAALDGSNPGMTFHLDEEELRSLGAELTADGEWLLPQGAVAFDTLIGPDRIGEARVLIPGAEKGRLALDDCRNEAVAATVSTDADAAAPSGTASPPPAEGGGVPEGDGSETGPDGEVTTTTPTSLRADILSLARAIVYGSDAPHHDGSTATDDQIQPFTLTVALPNGPADEASFHDFHTLQVAWKDVWTAMVDTETEEQLAAIYEAMVPVVGWDWANVTPDSAEVEELEDFMAHLGDAVEAAAEAAGGGGTPPQDLAEWLPALVEKWGWLTDEERKYIEFLKLVDDSRPDIVGHATVTMPTGSGAQGLPTGVESTVQHMTLFDLEGKFTPQFRSDLEKYSEDWRRSVNVFELQSVSWARDRATAVLVEHKAAPPEGESWVPNLGRARRLLQGISGRMHEPYRFDVFVPGSYNFGIVTTFRQKWQPKGHQVGDLVATIPLAPGEKRTYTKKRAIKTSRAQKEIERSLSVRSGESTETTRAETEILRKASASTNFKMTAEGGVNAKIAHVSASAEYGANQAQESGTTKRSFREAVRKAAEEYRRERTVEVTTEFEVTDEFTETGEIHNTNDELTVTYLLYELQRRVEMSERLHRVTPVVLVAFDVPPPDAIDEDWLLAHEWILRRVILDDSLVPALDYLSDSFAGDEVGVEILRTQWETQIETVRELTADLSVRELLRSHSRARLASALRDVQDSTTGLLESVGDFLFGDDDDSAKAEARRQAAQQVLDWADLDFTRAEQQLAAAVSSLTAATDAYTAALRQRLNRRVAIDQLRIHVKDNILYYMQAIWLHEPSDQRYFRVYDKEVIWPPLTDLTFKLKVNPWHWMAVKFWHTLSSSLQLKITIEGLLQPFFGIGTRQLHEVADVDQLLGFKGNYAMFSLKEHNAITLFMAQAFLDNYLEVLDPDPYGEMPSPTEAVDIAECAWRKAGTDEEAKREITTWLLDVLDNQRLVSEQLVIPTGQLYIEALPGAHPLLETFKLRHRHIDVERAAAGLRQAQLEALRYAARIAVGEHADPEVQTQIVTTDGDLGINVP